MKPIRVFYDDMYIYQEVCQPIEGQAVPLVIKIGIGTKPEYQKLASHIEKLYEEIYTPKENNSEGGELAALISAGKNSPLLPPEYYAEHTIIVSKRGNIYHLEYHSLPEPTLYLCIEQKDVPELSKKEVVTAAYLCDQAYVIDNQAYIVSSLKGNYANFPRYSPFFLEKEKYRTFTFDQKTLIESGAVFSASERGKGQKINTLLWFREKFIPWFLVSCFGGFIFLNKFGD